MQLEIEQRPLKSVLVQVIETQGGVILKRGVLETLIEGERAKEAVQLILALTAQSEVSREQILEPFAEPDRAAVDALLDQLIARRILERVDTECDTAAHKEEDSCLDMFYWNFEAGATQVADSINEKKIAVIGVNLISRQMGIALEGTGVRNFEVVDYPLLRNVSLFGNDEIVQLDHWNLKPPLEYVEWTNNLRADSLDCLVATSDFGGLHAMREWNELCVANGFHFFPIVLQNLIGYVGPLVVPGETACFECLRARQNAHLDNPMAYRAAEPEAFSGQVVAGYHPSMASILGDIGVMELTKLYGGALPMRQVGTLIEVNLLRPEIQRRKVLKIPRCSVCSPLRNRASIAALKSTFFPGNPIEP